MTDPAHEIDPASQAEAERLDIDAHRTWWMSKLGGPWQPPYGISQEAWLASAVALRSQNATLMEALELAVCMLAPHEPGDSRAVSSEFVALAGISCGMPDDGSYTAIIKEALAKQRALSAPSAAPPKE